LVGDSYPPAATYFILQQIRIQTMNIFRET